MNIPFRTLLALGLAAVLTACGTTVVNPVTGQKERSVMDEKSEIEQGRKAHGEILKEYGRYDDVRLQAYVNDVGQKLAAQSHRAHLTWTFTVLDSPEVNAFALPGGYVYVTRGILAHLNSEAELAGVVGHEIGHVTARHGAQRATRQQDASLGTLAAVLLGAVLEGQGVKGATDIAGQVSTTAAAGYLAAYSREQELQADELGAEYLARNRYDARHMVDVIGVLKDQERFAIDAARAEGRSASSGTNWLSSHPSNDQRLSRIREIAQRHPATLNADDGRERYLRAIDGITFGDSREQGVVRGQDFFHEPLGFAISAPSGWQIVNGPSELMLVNASRDAALLMEVLPEKAGRSHDAILRQLQPVSGRTERRSLNGFAATQFDGRVRTSQGREADVRLTLVTGPGERVYLLRQAGKDAGAIQRAAPALRQAEATFRALTPADRMAARPWAVQIVSMPKGGYAELTRTAPSTLARAQDQLRLINGDYASSQPPATGTLVKTLRPRP